MRILLLLALAFLFLACNDARGGGPTTPTTIVEPTIVTTPTSGEPAPPTPEPAPTPAPKPDVYLCSERDRMIAEFLATNPTLPIIKRLPSGERVYFGDYPECSRGCHVDGPVCEAGGAR